jgi:hypothetical protein
LGKQKQKHFGKMKKQEQKLNVNAIAIMRFLLDSVLELEKRARAAQTRREGGKEEGRKDCDLRVSGAL